MPLRREATIHADGPIGRPWWLSHSTWSLAVPPSSADGDQSDIHPMRRGGAKSFVDDLVLGRGVVLSRAATSLRSIETQPWTRRFVRFRRRTHLRRWSEAEALCLFVFFFQFFFLCGACQSVRVWHVPPGLGPPCLFCFFQNVRVWHVSPGLGTTLSFFVSKCKGLARSVWTWSFSGRRVRVWHVPPGFGRFLAAV